MISPPANKTHQPPSICPFGRLFLGVFSKQTPCAEPFGPNCETGGFPWQLGHRPTEIPNDQNVALILASLPGKQGLARTNDFAQVPRKTSTNKKTSFFAQVPTKTKINTEKQKRPRCQDRAPLALKLDDDGPQPADHVLTAFE